MAPSSSLVKLERHASCTPPTSAGLKNIKLILPYTKNLTLIQPKLLQMVPYLHLISFIATNLEIKEPKIIWPLRRLHVLHFTMASLKLIHPTFPSFERKPSNTTLFNGLPVAPCPILPLSPPKPSSTWLFYGLSKIYIAYLCLPQPLFCQCY